MQETNPHDYEVGAVYRFADNSGIFVVRDEFSADIVSADTGVLTPCVKLIHFHEKVFKIIDPAEMAYWLLKLENKRNNNNV